MVPYGGDRWQVSDVFDSIFFPIAIGISMRIRTVVNWIHNTGFAIPGSVTIIGGSMNTEIPLAACNRFLDFLHIV